MSYREFAQGIACKCLNKSQALIKKNPTSLTLRLIKCYVFNLSKYCKAMLIIIAVYISCKRENLWMISDNFLLLSLSMCCARYSNLPCTISNLWAIHSGIVLTISKNTATFNGYLTLYFLIAFLQTLVFYITSSESPEPMF